MFYKRFTGEKLQERSDLAVTGGTCGSMDTEIPQTPAALSGISLQIAHGRQLSVRVYSNVSHQLHFPLTLLSRLLPLPRFYSPILIIIPLHHLLGLIPPLPSFAKDLCFHP